MGSEVGSSNFVRVKPEMGSSDRLFNRRRTVHEVLGGGLGKSNLEIVRIDELLLLASNWVCSSTLDDSQSKCLLDQWPSQPSIASNSLFLWVQLFLSCIKFYEFSQTQLKEFCYSGSRNGRSFWVVTAGLIFILVSAVADVLLWRLKNVTMGILLVTIATWVVFERSSYTLLSLLSSVLLLLLSILFFWSKSAALLNRPAPPLPRLHLSEETVNEVASSIRHWVNSVLSTSQDIALGKDTKLFFQISAYLLLLCIVGCSTDLLTLGYTSLIVALTVPAVYERYEDRIDRYLIMAYKKSKVLYSKSNTELPGAVQRWTQEKEKVS